MSPHLRVAVFRRSDGAVLYDADFGDAAADLPTAKAVWAVVQVLLQFDREVGGGGVRSVVLRGADAPADARAFGAPRPRPPFKVAVAYGTLLAVTLTTSAGQTFDINAPCDQIHKFVLTTLLHRASAEDVGSGSAGNSFDLRAYMESFVSSDGSESSSLMSSFETSSGSQSRTESLDNRSDSAIDEVDIDVAALGAEVQRVVEHYFEL